jgi:hypothetical protein
MPTCNRLNQWGNEIYSRVRACVTVRTMRRYEGLKGAEITLSDRTVKLGEKARRSVSQDAPSCLKNESKARTATLAPSLAQVFSEEAHINV